MQDNKVVIVTGASAGLGKALCTALTERGYKVGAIARNQAALSELEQELGTDQLLGVAADVADAQQVQSAVDSIVEKFGRVDAVFNNAALYPRQNIIDQDINEFKFALDVNVSALVNTLKSVHPIMQKQGAGRIINLGSWAHMGPIPEAAVYSASKGAVHSLSKGFAADLEAKHIPISIIEWIPGHLNTQMSEYTGMEPAIAANWGVDLLDVDLSGKAHAIFEQNWEWLPPKGLKEKIKGKLLFWKK
jgi:NADP-dependent 3-hydroxy acid dehydrogenase YdfG